METLALPPQPTQRKKLWHIEGCYKCALIGTCLSRAELRKLSRERQFVAEPGLDDYQLHAHFIKISDQDDDQAKALGKYLEKKYRSAAKKYLKAETDQAIKALWDEDLAEGRVDSAWWGILTHPQGSLEIVAEGKSFGLVFNGSPLAVASRGQQTLVAYAFARAFAHCGAPILLDDTNNVCGKTCGTLAARLQAASAAGKTASPAATEAAAFETTRVAGV